MVHAVPVEDDVVEIMGLGNRPGWVGIFTREQYPGAMPSGTRVKKIGTLDGDDHVDGDTATILGSIGHPEVGVLYFVEWDDAKKVAVGVQSNRVEAI